MKRLVATIGLTAVLSALPPLLLAQWPSHPSAKVPRTPDGKPDLTAPTPRTADGKPDLSGIWQRGGGGQPGGGGGGGRGAAPAANAAPAPPATPASGPPVANFGNVGA